MDLEIKADWETGRMQEDERAFKDILDESDAYLYQQVIKELSPEKKKKGKKRVLEPKNVEKGQKISEYYQNFCKKSNFKDLNSTKTVAKNYNGISLSYKSLSKFKDVGPSQNLRYSACSGKTQGQKKPNKQLFEFKKD